MATICLYGDLRQYGPKFKMNADTASEALNGLYVQIKGLRKAIMDGWFRVRINKRDITDSTVRFGLHSKLPNDSVIHIVPKTAGAKNSGVFSFIAGAVMVVAGAVAMYFGQPWGASLIAGGIGMMVGGVAMMLTKTPKIETNSEITKKSTSFSSLDNAIAQGAPVPLIYGRMMIGSKVLSQGIETMDVE